MLFSGNLIVNFPFSSVLLEIAVPLTLMVTPGKISPLLPSVTVPETVTSAIVVVAVVLITALTVFRFEISIAVEAKGLLSVFFSLKLIT